MLTIRTIADGAVVKLNGLVITGRQFVAVHNDDPLSVLWVHPDVEDEDGEVANVLAMLTIQQYDVDLDEE